MKSNNDTLIKLAVHRTTSNISAIISKTRAHQTAVHFYIKDFKAVLTCLARDPTTHIKLFVKESQLNFPSWCRTAESNRKKHKKPLGRYPDLHEIEFKWSLVVFDEGAVELVLLL